jgi:hypothetical protein
MEVGTSILLEFIVSDVLYCSQHWMLRSCGSCGTRARRT